MTPRASWKGALTIGEWTCPVALYAAVPASGRITLNLINRATGNRVHRHYVDSEDGTEVDRDDQVRGYGTKSGEVVLLEPEEIAASVPDSDRTLTLSTFIRCAEVDDVYLDRPYYLCPVDAAAGRTFALIRDSLARQKVVALSTTVLFRRVRTLLIRAHDDMLIATTLNFDDEVRPAQDVFSAIPDRRLPREMLDLADHIIETKKGRFAPAAFTDRYEARLADLVRAKLAGRKPPPARRPPTGTVISLMDALRESAGKNTPRPGRRGARTRRRAG